MAWKLASKVAAVSALIQNTHMSGDCFRMRHEYSMASCVFLKFFVSSILGMVDESVARKSYGRFGIARPRPS
jgi:hypothetical protein